MTDFRQIARELEMQHNDVKWYESVDRMVAALEKADADAYERGVNDGLTGRRERGVRILDEYAPPVGKIVTAPPKPECDGGCYPVCTWCLTKPCGCEACRGLAAFAGRFAHIQPLPQGDGADR